MRPVEGDIVVVHVDDDAEFGEVAAAFLEREHEAFDVESVTSADDALSVIEEREVDCVVSDYEMPGTDGISLLETVRESHPDLPYILFTGKGSEAVASDAISAGVTDYLQKETGTDQYAVLANRIENTVARYRTDRELAATRERMEFALEATDSIVFEVDLDTLVDRHHGPFERLYGCPAADVATADEFNERCVHPADRDRIDQYREPEAFADADGRVEFEFRTNPDNGEVRWIHSEAYVDAGEDGTTRRLVGIDTDVTERKERERDLELKDRAVDAAPVGITLTDGGGPGGTVRYANDRFLDLVGYPREEVVGASHRLFEGPDTRESARAALREAMADGAEATVELRYYRASGEPFWNRLSVAPVRDDGAVTNWVAFHRDVTGQTDRTL